MFSHKRGNDDRKKDLLNVWALKVLFHDDGMIIFTVLLLPVFEIIFSVVMKEFSHHYN